MMTLAKTIACMMLPAAVVHADVDIVVSQKGPDVEFVATGSINLDGYLAPRTGPEWRQDQIDLRSLGAGGEGVFIYFTSQGPQGSTINYSERSSGRLADTTEGSLAGCSMSTSLLGSAASVDGNFRVTYFAFTSSANPTETETSFTFDAGYQSGDPINVVARFLETTIDEVFVTPDQFPCTWTVPGGLSGLTETFTIRLDPPRTPAPSSLAPSTAAPSTAAPTTLAPTFLAPSTLPPTPTPTVTIHGAVFVKVLFPSRSTAPLDASHIDEAGAAICHHIARYLQWVYRPHDVAVPECTWEVRLQLRNQLRMIFRYNAVISGVDSLHKGGARTAELEIETIVEESLSKDEVRGELVSDLQGLSDTNPLSDTTSVELDSHATTSEAAPTVALSCALVPEFLEWIPILGSVLNTVLCILFGPDGILSNFFG